MSGFSSDRLEQYRSAIRDVVSSGTVPGMVTLIAHGDDVRIDAVGVADIASGEPMREDMIFRIQSMTKPVLAVATLQLIERGTLSLDEAIERWVPELADRMVLRTPGSELDDVVPAHRAINVEDLLTCRSGYGAIMDDPARNPMARAMEEHGVAPGPTFTVEPSDEWIARFRDLPLIHQPGEGWRYHTSFEILGVLLSRVTGMSLGDYLESSIFAPLEMRDTSFFVNAEKRHRLPASYNENGAGGFDELEPAGGSYHAEPPSFEVSHGELLSTAHDYHRFASMVMRGGELDAQCLLSAELVARMVIDHVPASQKTDDSFFPGFWDTDGWGYGVSVTTMRDEFGEEGRYGWSGGLGTTWFNDPTTGLIGIAMAQTMMSGSVMKAINAFYAASFAALGR